MLIVFVAAVVVWRSVAGAPEDRPVAELAPAATPSDRGAVPALESATNEDADTSLLAAGASGTELIEVCGVGWVPEDASGSADLAAVGAVPDVVASQRAILDSLRRNDGELGLAIATFLELHGATRAGVGGDPWLSLVCKPPDCVATEDDRRLASTLVEQLAKQASAGRDPRAYALALRGCLAVPELGSCALLNLEQWARLDEGNGVPWLHILERARQRKDAAQIDEALYRIGAAARYEDSTFIAPGMVAERTGAGEVDLVAGQLLAVDAFIHASSRATPLQALAAACSAAELADANRRQACDNAAAILIDRSDSLAAVALGATLGRRLGWSDDRIDAARALGFARDAMARDREAVPVTEAVALGAPTTCNAARRALAFFAKQGPAGEVQPIRDWLAATGRTIEPYARQAREVSRQRDEVEAKHAAAAAASAAASAALALAPGGASPYSEAPPPSR